MSDCTERGHKYELVLINDELLYACVNGCGDITPIMDDEPIRVYKDKIIELLKEIDLLYARGNK